MSKRSLDQTLGFIGGLLGIVIGALSLLISSVESALHVGGSMGLLGAADVMILFSLIGLFGAYMLPSRKKDGSLIMIVIGVAGIIALSNLVSWVPFVILLIAGLIARLQ